MSSMVIVCTLLKWKDRKQHIIIVCVRKAFLTVMALSSSYQRQSSVRNKLQNTKLREGYPLYRGGEETWGSRTNVKSPFPFKLFSCWCFLQPSAVAGTQNQSHFHILLRQNHFSLLWDFEKPSFKITAREKIHNLICSSFRKILQLFTFQPLVRYSDA